MFLHLAIITFIIWYLISLWDRRKLLIQGWKFPGPFSWPIIGNAWFVRTLNEKLDVFGQLCYDYKSPFRMWLGPRLLICLSTPEQCESMCNAPQCLDKGYMYSFVQTLLGPGLFTLSGQEWKMHRKALNSTFSQSILRSFYPIFNRNCLVLSQNFGKLVGTGPVNLYNYIDSCSLDMICETTMGTELKCQEGDSPIKQSANTLMGTMSARMFKIWLHPSLFWKYSPTGKLSARAEKIAFGYVDAIVDEKMKFYKELYGKYPNTVDDENSPSWRGIFIDQLAKMQIKEQLFSRDDALAESRTIIVAGYETSALVTSYTLLLMAMHPEIQELVFDEMKTLFPTQDGEVSFTEVANMPYTERVIKESMRLFPPVPLITRLVRQDFHMDEYTVPAGAECVVNIRFLHRDVRVWGPDALTFNPDNFLPENVQARHPGSYMPFGGGPRSCIGMRYAMIAIKIILAYLVRRYKFTTHLKMDELEVAMNITLKLMNKHMVEIHERSSY